MYLQLGKPLNNKNILLNIEDKSLFISETIQENCLILPFQDFVDNNLRIGKYKNLDEVEIISILWKNKIISNDFFWNSMNDLAPIILKEKNGQFNYDKIIVIDLPYFDKIHDKIKDSGIEYMNTQEYLNHKDNQHLVIWNSQNLNEIISRTLIDYKLDLLNNTSNKRIQP